MNQPAHFAVYGLFVALESCGVSFLIGFEILAQFQLRVRIDLKRPEGLAVIHRLAARADVLVENFRPGVMERLGLGYEMLAAANPGLVYVSVNGFGSDGPYRDLPAYDGVIQGLVGFAAVQGGAGTPALVRCIAADKTTGTTAVYATLAALFARERGDGRGQHVEVPMLNAYAAFMLGVCLLACIVPTRRALRVEPIVAMRVD